MMGTIREIDGVKIVECNEPIARVDQAIDLVTACIEAGSRRLLLDAENPAAAFARSPRVPRQKRGWRPCDGAKCGFDPAASGALPWADPGTREGRWSCAQYADENRE
jgi:hypothetical protein